MALHFAFRATSSIHAGSRPTKSENGAKVAKLGLALRQGSNAACSLALKPDDGVVASRRHGPRYDSSSRLASRLDGGAIKRHFSPDRP
jgi:hypothetical protein